MIGTLYLLGVCNSIAADVVVSVAANGFWSAAANTFGVSVVVIAAAAVGLRLNARSAHRPIDGWDRGVGLLFVIILCVPLSAGSSAALTLLAAYEAARQFRSREIVAAAVLFVGIATSLTWGHLLLELLAGPLLATDSIFVASLLNLVQGGGVERVGNLIETAHGQPLAIMIGCSSVSQVSYALLCWMTVLRSWRTEWRRADLYTITGVILAVVAFNVFRMTLMGLSRNAYLLIHGPLGADVFNSLILIVAAAAAWPPSSHANQARTSAV